MNNRITFRLSEDMEKKMEEVYELLRKEGLDLDDSKVVRYLIQKGYEKLKLENKL